MGQRDNVPARSVSCQPPKKGWIEQQRQGPKNETFYRITDAGLVALKAPVPIQGKPGKTAEHRCSPRVEAEGEEMSDGDASLRG
jgi:hypothetical protein